MLRLFRVSGRSMLPNYLDGDVVLVLRIPARWFRAGQAVVVNAADVGYVIKRLEAVCVDRRVRIRSDNSDTASSVCGRPHAIDDVAGVVIATLWRRKSDVAARDAV